jgi:hypothetical protein
MEPPMEGVGNQFISLSFYVSLLLSFFLSILLSFSQRDAGRKYATKYRKLAFYKLE